MYSFSSVGAICNFIPNDMDYIKRKNTEALVFPLCKSNNSSTAGQSTDTYLTRLLHCHNPTDGATLGAVLQPPTTLSQGIASETGSCV